MKHDVFGLDSLKKHATPAVRLSEKKLKNFTPQAQSRPLGTCNTSTFYMHLKGPSGNKINLSGIVTLPDGNFFLAGNITLANSEQEGLISIMTNSGNMVVQQRVRINNKPSRVFNVKALLDGRIAMCGIVHDVTDKVFVSILNSDLTTNWLKVFTMPQAPVKVVLDLEPDNQVAFAVQLPNDVFFSMLKSDGSLLWSQKISPAGLNGIAGIGHNDFAGVTLALNCTSGGKKLVDLVTIDGETGNITSANTLGDGTTERLAENITSFASRFIGFGISKDNAGQFKLVRDISFNSTNIETEHTYIIPGTVDFGTTCAVDNAGDALGICLPQQGKMVYIRHFAYYQTAPEYTREYAVPVGASMIGVTRSLTDGGYLFGMNTANAGECILIKTDSIGILAGCGYQDISNNYTEGLQTDNTAISVAENSIATTVEPSAMIAAGTVLSTQTDCNQSFCPTAPPDDTCLSSYFKVFRSNSYIDAFGPYYLMRNNNHLMFTTRYDRIAGSGNQLTAGIKIFNEKGIFIKGVKIFIDVQSTPVGFRKVDESHIMLISYSVTADGIACFTFTLINDDLQIVWTKSVKTFKDFNYNSSGIFGDFTTDKEGNFYFVGNSLGFGEGAKVLAYKMDANGNDLWLKVYQLQAQVLFSASATATNTSLVVVIEGGNKGSVSVQLDKTTGEFKNAYLYNNGGAGSIYNRLLQFDNDRIFYAGNDPQSNFVMGIFDSSGRPKNLKHFNQDGSIVRAATVQSGNLYAMYQYWNGTALKNVLLKADADLALKYIHESAVTMYDGLPVGLRVSDNGSIYAAGNYSYGGIEGSYYDPFLKKFDANGVLGTCSYENGSPEISDIDLNTTSVGMSAETNVVFTPISIAVDLVPDEYGQQISQVLCSSMPSCNSISIKGVSSICLLNQPYPFVAGRNPGCTIYPVWIYDTAFASIKNITDSSADFAFKQTGSTWIKAILNIGCSVYTDSMLIKIQYSPATLSLGNDTAICKGNSVVLHAGKGFNSYRWQDGSTDSTLIVTTAGQYFVRVDNICGNSSTDTIVVKEVNIPALNIGRDTMLCFGDTMRIVAPSGFKSYEWQPASLLSTSAPQQVDFISTKNESVTLTAITGEGCKASDTLAIAGINPRTIHLGSDTSFCISNPVLFSAGSGYLQYIWSTGATTEFITVTQPGLYWVQAKDVNGCFAKDTIQVLTVYPVPPLSLGNDFNLCEGEQRQLDAGNFNKYTWQDGSFTRYYTVSKPGTYSVSILDSLQCLAADTVVIKQLFPGPANFLQPVDSICQYEQLPVKVIGSYITYMWSTGSIEPGVTVTAPGNYILTVKDVNGCTGSDTIRIVQKDCFSSVYIPSAFSPNGDALNDVFKPKVYGTLVSYQLEIFNRYGARVFITADPQKGWDGKVKGASQPGGPFVWQCRYQFRGKLLTYQSGTVLLMH